MRGEESSSGSSAKADPPVPDPLALRRGEAAPDPVILTAGQGVLEALPANGAAGAHGSNGGRVGPSLREEQFTIEAGAGCVVLPALDGPQRHRCSHGRPYAGLVTEMRPRSGRQPHDQRCEHLFVMFEGCGRPARSCAAASGAGAGRTAPAVRRDAPAGSPALNREQAADLYAELIRALLEVRRLKRPPGV